MTQTIAPQLVHNVSLRTDFGHSPVGSLGGRTVQQTQAQPSRTAGQVVSSFATSVKALGTRVLNAMTPEGMRAESKVRAGLEQTSQQMGELLGALSKTKDTLIDGATVLKLINGMGDTMAPLTTRGAEYKDVFVERLDVNLKGMSTQQLLALKEGVGMAQNSALKSTENIGQHLVVIENAVKAELTERLLAKAVLQMEPMLAKCVSALPLVGKFPQAVSMAYADLYNVSSELLKAHGMTGKDPAEYKNLQASLINEAINRMIDQGKVPYTEVGKVLQHIPSKELHKLAHAGEPIGTIPFKMERMVTGAIGVRSEKSEVGFMEESAKLLAHKEPVVEDPTGPLHNPVGFAKEVIAAAKHVKDTVEHAGIHSLTISEPSQLRARELAVHLQQLIKPENLMLSELSNERLLEFSKALDTLGIKDSAEALINKEIANRRDVARNEYRAAVNEVRDAVVSGRLPDVLREVAKLAQTADRVSLAFQHLGEDLDGADQVAQFRGDLMLDVLKSMNIEELGALYGKLNSPQMKALANTLGDVGSAMVSNPKHADRYDPRLGQAMYNACLDLMTLGQGVEEALNEKGVNLPPPPDEKEYGSKDLTGQSIHAIREVYGTVVTAKGDFTVKAGVGGPNIQQIFDDNLAEPPSPEALTSSRQKTGVCQALWADLPRDNYMIKGDDGMVSPLIDRQTLIRLTPQEKEQQMLGAVDRLRDLVGGDEDLLMLVSQIPNQSSLAGLQKILMSADSPVQLPNGIPGRLMTNPGDARTSYTLSSDGEGGVVVQCVFSEENAHSFLDPNSGNMTRLDPDRSKCSMSFEITITAAREVRVTEPVTYMFDLEVDPFNKDYPTPKSMADILGSPHADLRNDFRSFVEGRHIGENLHFLEQHALFKSNPTLEGARALTQQFIGDTADEYINIAYTESAQILDTLRGENAENLTASQLVELFEPAEKQVLGMMNNGPVKEFVKANSTPI